MRIWNAFLIPALVLGLAGVTQAKRAKPLATTATPLAESLKSAHKLLVEADHDYKGHRAKAAERVHAALKELGQAPATSGKGAGRSERSHPHEPQAASDAKLREALSILKGISTSGNSGVAAHVNGAIKEIDMVELTQEQRHALAGTDSPVFVDPDTQQSYVLVRKEVFDRMKGLLYDDSEWTSDEQLRLLAESGRRAGWDAPDMDVYDHYDENRKNPCP